MSKKRLSNKVTKKSNNTAILIVIVAIGVIAGLIFVYATRDILKENGSKQAVSGENILLDPGFEDLNSILQETWSMAGFETKNYTIIYQGVKIENSTLTFSNEVKYNGTMSAYIHGVDIYPKTVITNWNQKINDSNIIPYGKDLIFSCWIRTTDADDVILMIQCWKNEDLSIENMIKSQDSKSYDSINGTNNWHQYSIKLVNVPSNTKVITVRLGLIGTVEVWFDDAELYATN